MPRSWLLARLRIAALAAVGLGEREALGQTSIDSLLVLEWSAPPECPDRKNVVARVESLIGDSDASGQRVEARAVVTRSGPRYRLDLVVRGPKTSKRTLDGEDCEKLASA